MEEREEGVGKVEEAERGLLVVQGVGLLEGAAEELWWMMPLRLFVVVWKLSSGNLANYRLVPLDYLPTASQTQRPGAVFSLWLPPLLSFVSHGRPPPPSLVFGALPGPRGCGRLWFEPWLLSWLDRPRRARPCHASF